MSELLNKAAAFEEKEKWKNAADTYYKAAEEFIITAKPNEAKDSFLKALANAEKAEYYQMMVDSIFSYIKLASEEEKKEILPKAFAPIDILMAEIVAKKKYDEILEYISKKELAARITNQNYEETLIEKGKYLHEYAWDLIANKKIEERKKAFDFLSKASEV
ncbi:MAG: hypothetical protein FK731_06600, partial [Asgard group archaeon]|nr:hypothetical protein [Asgard group archaeon]